MIYKKEGARAAVMSRATRSIERPHRSSRHRLSQGAMPLRSALWGGDCRQRQQGPDWSTALAVSSRVAGTDEWEEIDIATPDGKPADGATS